MLLGLQNPVFMGKELRGARLLALSDRGRVFTQFLNYKLTHLSIISVNAMIKRNLVK